MKALEKHAMNILKNFNFKQYNWLCVILIKIISCFKTKELKQYSMMSY